MDSLKRSSGRRRLASGLCRFVFDVQKVSGYGPVVPPIPDLLRSRRQRRRLLGLVLRPLPELRQDFIYGSIRGVRRCTTCQDGLSCYMNTFRRLDDSYLPGIV